MVGNICRVKRCEVPEEVGLRKAGRCESGSDKILTLNIDADRVIYLCCFMYARDGLKGTALIRKVLPSERIWKKENKSYTITSGLACRNSTIAQSDPC